MADYVDSAFAYLQAWVDTFRQHYAPDISDELRRFGKTTRLMDGKQRVMNGSNIEYEVQAYHNRSSRATKDLMAAIPDPGPGSYVRFNVNFDHTDANANDIMALEIGFMTTIWDIWKRTDSNFKAASPDYLRRDFEQGMADVKETFARFLHLPADGAMAVIATDGKKDDDSHQFASASAYTPGEDTALIQCNPVSIARIGDGQMIEIRSSAGVLRNDHLKVTYVNPFEETIAVTVTTNSTNADLDDPVATDEIFLNQSYNVTPEGTFDGFFDETVAYYGKDRLLAANKMLMPIIMNLGGADLTADHFVRAGETAGWMGGDGNALNRKAMIMSRNEYRWVNSFVEAAGQVFVPALESDVGQKLNRAFGHDGFILHDPNLGTSMVVVDDFAPYGKIRFLEMDHWEMVTPVTGGFRMLPGSIAGIWERMGESDGSGKLGKRFQAQGIQAFAFVSTFPKHDASLEGINTKAV